MYATNEVSGFVELGQMWSDHRLGEMMRHCFEGADDEVDPYLIFLKCVFVGHWVYSGCFGLCWLLFFAASAVWALSDVVVSGDLGRTVFATVSVASRNGSSSK